MCLACFCAKKVQLPKLFARILICEEKDGGPLFNQAESFLEQKGRVLAYETFVTNPIYTYAQKLSQQVGVTILKRKGDLKKAITPPKKKERKKKDDEQLELFDL